MLASVVIDYKKFVSLQVLLLVVGSFATFMMYGIYDAKSFVMGGLVMLLANAVFFLRLFFKKQFEPSIELMIFFLSELIKLIIVAAVTVIIAIYIKASLFPYIFGLILLQLATCFIPMFLKRVR
jgi:F0F1-type ATP synthase assembly protein I